MRAFVAVYGGDDYGFQDFTAAWFEQDVNSLLDENSPFDTSIKSDLRECITRVNDGEQFYGIDGGSAGFFVFNDDMSIEDAIITLVKAVDSDENEEFELGCRRFNFLELVELNGKKLFTFY